MTYRRLCAAAALWVGAMTAPAAWADVTARQVWEQMQDFSKATGQSLSGTVTQKDKVLTVQGAAYSVEQPDMQARASIGTITLTERRDGTVEITLPAEYPMTVSAAPQDGKPFSMSAIVTLDRPVVIASGTGAVTNYDFDARQITLSIRELDLDGEPVSADIRMGLSMLEGSYALTKGLHYEATANLRAQKATIGADVAPPEQDGHVSFVAGLENMVMKSQSEFPATDGSGDLGKMLESGLITDGSLRYDGAQLQATSDIDDKPFSLEGSNSGGTLSYAMNDQNITYGGTQTGIKLAVSGADLPLAQIKASIQDTAFNIKLPTGQTDEPAAFGLLTTLRGIALDDAVWALIDPQAMLPHDPATLTFDLSGIARLFVDVFNPDALADLDGRAGELHQLTINDVELSAAGASLTGSGAFTFDNSNPSEPFPVPIGSASLRLTGSDTLLDRLTKMKVIEPFMAMTARSMLKNFAQPGEDDDTMTSEITATPDGQILLNGQRIR